MLVSMLPVKNFKNIVFNMGMVSLLTVSTAYLETVHSGHQEWKRQTLLQPDVLLKKAGCV